MRRMYWSPKKASRSGLLVIGCVAVMGLLFVELRPMQNVQPWCALKHKAARKAAAMMQTIRQERVRRGCPVDSDLDPLDTGMIGMPVTAVTTAKGHLTSKRAAANPNMAAGVVELLRQAGVRRGDVVAVGYSGSFPGGNVAVLAALEAVGVCPVILGSVGSSQFGANLPPFLWPDMQRTLRDQDQTTFRMRGCSLGGTADRGLGLPPEGRQALREAIRRNELPMLGCERFEDGVRQRMALYDLYAEGRPIRAYINVGGGTLSVGRSLGKTLCEPGLNLQPPAGCDQLEGVIPRFFQRGTPVIHLVQFDRLSRQFGIVDAAGRSLPVGHGATFVESRYNRWLAAAVLVILLVSLKLLVLGDAAERGLKFLTRRRRSSSTRPVVGC